MIKRNVERIIYVGRGRALAGTRSVPALRFAVQSEDKCGFAAFARLAPAYINWDSLTYPYNRSIQIYGQKEILHITFAGQNKKATKLYLATLF